MLAPTRDVAVTYRVSGANRTNGAAIIKMTYADHDQKVRLDLFAFEGATTPFGSLIYDQPDNRVLSLIRDRNAYFELPATGRVNPGLMLGANMQYKRLGTATIAGQKCTDWQVSDGAEDKGTTCVTDDGIVLRGTRLKPKPSGIEAIAIDYGTPPDSIFQPDPGLVLQSNQPGLPVLPAQPRR
ncbi:MAG TPA: hypothetical protein VND19_06015 [Acetobacteraceae bacterium]|nr:hypothetical protein [Acetobacteraceae bacterium]